MQISLWFIKYEKTKLWCQWAGNVADEDNDYDDDNDDDENWRDK